MFLNENESDKLLLAQKGQIHFEVVQMCFFYIFNGFSIGCLIVNI